MKKTTNKQNRELLLTVSVFLLGREELRNLFWNVNKVEYNKTKQKVRIGINTMKGKLGTTLAKLRKTAKYLSDYLYEHGLTFRKAKIEFYVDKQGEEVAKLYTLLEQISSKSTDG